MSWTIVADRHERTEDDEEERARNSGPDAYFAWLHGFESARDLRRAQEQQRHARAINPVRNQRKRVPSAQEVSERDG